VRLAFRFNPLGGGAWSGSQLPCGAVAADPDQFQSPRRWGGVGLSARNPSDLFSFRQFRFNPLGGGAGSGSHQHLVSIFGGIRKVISFQSPRRWGGVGLSANRATSARLNLSFNPLRGGAGSGWSIWQALLNAFACLVSIPSAVGRGRAREHGLYPSTPRPVCFVSIPLEVGRGRARWEWLFHSSSSYLGFNPLGGGAGSGSSPSRD